MEPFDLDRLQLATPCANRWEDMAGDDRVRHCAACRLNVYDLSALPRREAETLVATREGRICVRMLRRPDGRVLTRDCGPVRAALRRRLRRIGTLVGGLLAFLGVLGCVRREPTEELVGVIPAPEAPAPGDASDAPPPIPDAAPVPSDSSTPR